MRSQLTARPTPSLTLLVLLCLSIPALAVTALPDPGTRPEGFRFPEPDEPETLSRGTPLVAQGLPHCIDDDNLCSPGCNPSRDSDCELLSRLELMERFLRTNQKGNSHTPDHREALVDPKSEVYRLLHCSQAIGYLELYAATGKQPYLREATERLAELTSLPDVWSSTAWDGDLGYAYLRAYELTGSREFLEQGVAAARRLSPYCYSQAYLGVCELNWGLSAAICLAKAHRLTGEGHFLETSRLIVALTQVFQREDGALPHQSDPGASNLAYSSWVAFQLGLYSALDPDVRNVHHLTVLHHQRSVTLDFDLMSSLLTSFLKRQVNEDGTISYYGGQKLRVVTDPECRYCSNPLFPLCKSYCEERCGPSLDGHPCFCIEDPLTECGTTKGEEPPGGPDPLCSYCSSRLYVHCADSCRSICSGSPDEFPCSCITDPERECPSESTWTDVTYYDDWDPAYDTRGWTSELASTAFALARSGQHDTKRKVLRYLFSVQNKDGSFPDKWGYRTEEPESRLWLLASDSHSVIRTSVVFRVLSSLLASSSSPHGSQSVAAASAGAESAPFQDTKLPLSAGDGVSVDFSAVAGNPGGVSPNPATDRVTLSFVVPGHTSGVRVVISDITGRTVRTLGEKLASGSTVGLVWDCTDDGGEGVAPGVYFAQAVSGNWRSVKKLVILPR